MRWTAGSARPPSRSSADVRGPAATAPGGMDRGTVAGLLAVVTLTALCYPLIALGLRYAAPIQFAALRAGVAGTALGLLAVALGRPFPRSPGVWVLIAVSGLSATSIGFLSMFGAAGLVSPGVATVVAGTQPIVAAVAALAIFGEPFGRRQGAGMALSLLGIAAIAAPDLAGGGTKATAGIALVVVATLGTAVGNAVTKRMASEVDPIAAAAAQLLLGSVPLAILSSAAEPWTARLLQTEFLAILAILALGGTAATYTLWIRILGRVPLNSANAFLSLVPVFGVAISVALFGERIGPVTVLGMALTLGGVVLASRGAAAGAGGGRVPEPGRRRPHDRVP